MENVVDARVVGQPAQQRGADARRAKGQSEEQAGDQPHVARHQFLGVDDDCRESRRQNHPDETGEHDGHGQADMRQQQRERRHAEDGNPNHELAADPVAHRPADDRARRHGKEKGKQGPLRTLHREMELIDQVERVVVAQADQVDVF